MHILAQNNLQANTYTPQGWAYTHGSSLFAAFGDKISYFDIFQLPLALVTLFP